MDDPGPGTLPTESFVDKVRVAPTQPISSSPLGRGALRMGTPSRAQGRRLQPVLFRGDRPDLSHDGGPISPGTSAPWWSKETPDGAYISKGGRESRRKVELAVAAVMAFDQLGDSPGSCG